jgi:hypothetical protein
MRMLILSGKKALHKQIRDIRPLEKQIDEYIESRKGYETIFYYYDMPNKLRIKPVKKKNKSIRNYVMKVEKKMGTIDVLLLLGGDDVIPFFRLDNPCDDGDEVVLSDNPYASRHDNFVIPERVCARIPDNQNVEFMKKQLTKAKPLKKKAFGLTAKIWKRASENVFRPIGDPKKLKTSPPVTSEKFKKTWLQNKDFLYFNVHGSKVSANWYGQEGAEYPVAVQPSNIKDASGIVASEACYGAYIIEKSQDDAMSLRFLDQDKVLGFCGSTTIAYGPAAPPSSEADLLVKYFFEYLKQGMTSGESLKNAKLDVARKALRRHGFLDDDDQKTLLQFVLYGDPTIRVQDDVMRS